MPTITFTVDGPAGKGGTARFEPRAMFEADGKLVTSWASPRLVKYTNNTPVSVVLPEGPWKVGGLSGGNPLPIDVGSTNADLKDLIVFNLPSNAPATTLSQAVAAWMDSNVNTEVTDPLMADLVADPESAVNAVLSAAYVPVTEFDLRSFHTSGTYPDNGVDDAAPLINSAITQINAIIAADTSGQIFTLNLGPGRFRLNSSINLLGGQAYAQRLKIKGDSRWRTILMPYGTASGFMTVTGGIQPDTPLDWWWYRNVHFEDFTIDARNQTYPEPGGLQKAFQGGGWLECTWNRITCIGTTATMFGNDYPVRCQMIDCHAIGAGRGTVTTGGPQAFAEMRSGFGIGFGHYDDESIDFIGCTATGCARSGFFFERQDSRGSLRRDAVIRMIDCEATFNGNGVTDAACAGVVAVNCKFTDNTAAGFYAGPNTQSKAGALYGRLTDCTILRNGVGVFMTGSYYDHFPYDVPFGAGGGYVIESSRIQENDGPGIEVKDFFMEAGGLTIRQNQLVRNGGPGVRMSRCSTPARELAVVGNDFDGNTGIGLALLIPANSPRITDNDFFNSDGVARQTDAIMFHPAEAVSLPRVQRNTFRRHARTLINAARLVATYITDNITLDAPADPASSALHAEYFEAKPDQTGLSTLGAGWSSAISTPTWVKTAGGVRPSTGTWGQLAIQYRDLGTSGVYVSTLLPPSAQGAGVNRFRGVAIAVSGDEAIIAGVDDVSTQLAGSGGKYAMWRINDGVPTLLWASTVPGIESHSVALAREAGSTMTTMFIDGIAVHTEDVPSIPVATGAGVAAASGVAGTSGSTVYTRHLHSVRAVATSTIDPHLGLVRNLATNPGFEVAGGWSSTWGTGGAGSTTRENNAGNAHSGTYSQLLTWSTASTDPSGGGGRFSAMEDVTVGKVYTCSAWVRSSTARKIRLNVNYFGTTGGTGTLVGSKSGTYVDVPANTWTRLTIQTDAIPSGAVSLRLDISAGSAAGGNANFAIGDTMRIDDVLVTEGTVLYDFFSGDTNGGAWVGTANASASTKMLPV